MRALEECAVGEDRLRIPFVDETDVGPLGMHRRMPRERVDQGPGIRRDRILSGRRVRPGDASRTLDRTVPRRVRGIPLGHPPDETRPARQARGPPPDGRPDRREGAEELARGSGFGKHPVRETGSGRPLQAREELHPREAVESEVAAEIGVEPRAPPGAPLPRRREARRQSRRRARPGYPRPGGTRRRPVRRTALRPARRLGRRSAAPRARPPRPRQPDRPRGRIRAERTSPPLRPISRLGGAGARRRAPLRRSTGSRCSGKGSRRERRAPLPRPDRGGGPETRSRS